MPRSSSRVVFALLTCTLLIPSCHSTPNPTGECTGTHLGRSVTWPLTSNSLQSTVSDSDGSAHTRVQLNYTPNGVSELVNWGVSITLTGEPRFEASPPRTAKLLPQQDRLVPEEPSLVLMWEGFTSSGSAYLSPPGVPVEGSLTLRRVTPDHAEGQFVYHYADGGILTCTFDVPDRLDDDGQDSDVGCGGGGGYDDDDDD
ncbi:hypothetical protein [Archangium lansingense]|uniref:Lipoprotein n=1 Tax=Archangium lansingense TaxID=2995310 RepID=A0ABT4A3X1_9BACT|nr:hypothetical protein [Archangium lansinium]MCY1076349.1 hypothetical protein [Archangium lansinium]